MCDLLFTFEEDQTKTVVATESDRYWFGQTYASSDFTSVHCHELHCTDNNVSQPRSRVCKGPCHQTLISG